MRTTNIGGLSHFWRGVGVPWTGSCATASAKIACEAARIACDICEAARIAARYARMEVCCENSCCLCDNQSFFVGIPF
jgi:hypothetical protein